MDMVFGTVKTGTKKRKLRQFYRRFLVTPFPWRGCYVFLSYSIVMDASRSGGIAQLVEHVLCKHEVTGSSPVASTSLCQW